MAAQAQTNVTTGAAEVRAFFVRNATTVYAAAYGGGLHLSTDTGASFTRVALPGNDRYLTSLAGTASVMVIGAEEGLLRTTNFTTFAKVLHEPVSAVAVSGTTVLAAVPGLGILRSADSGASFVQANNAGFDSLHIVSIAFHPGNGNIAFAAAKPKGDGSGGGVFRSGDGGQSWASFNGALPNRYATAVQVDTAGNVYAGLIDNFNQGDVYTSPSGAASWTASGDVFGGVASIHRDANTPTTMWVGGRGFGLYVGSGTAFNYAYNQTGAPNILLSGINATATFPGNTNVVLKALRGTGIWRSTVNATPRAWTRIMMPGADRVRSATGVAGGGNSTMLAGLHAGGVWRSADSGGSWSPPIVNASQADFSFAPDASAVLPFLTIWELAASPGNPNWIWAAAGGLGMHYTNDASGLFRYNGFSWGGVFQEAPPAAPYFGFPESGLGHTGSGANWGPTYGISLNRGDDNIAYASFLSDGFGVLKRGAGPAWSVLGIPAGPPQIRTVVTSAIAARALALPFDDKPYLSNNANAASPTFSAVTISQTGAERIRFFSAAENPSNTNNWIGGTNKGLFVSNDGGQNWTRIPMAATFQRQVVNAVGFRPGTGIAFAADFAGNRYCSSNGGASWVSAGAALRAGVNAIKAIGSQLYYLTDGGGMFLESGSC